MCFLLCYPLSPNRLQAEREGRSGLGLGLSWSSHWQDPESGEDLLTLPGSLSSRSWSTEGTISPCPKAPSYMRSRGCPQCGTEMAARGTSADHVTHHFMETRVQRGWVTCSGTQNSSTQPSVLPPLPSKQTQLLSLAPRTSFCVVSLPERNPHASATALEKRHGPQ